MNLGFDTVKNRGKVEVWAKTHFPEAVVIWRTDENVDHPHWAYAQAVCILYTITAESRERVSLAIRCDRARLWLDPNALVVEGPRSGQTVMREIHPERPDMSRLM